MQKDRARKCSVEGRGLQGRTGNAGKPDRLPAELRALGYSAHSALRAPSVGLVAVYWVVLFIILWIGFLMCNH